MTKNTQSDSKPVSEQLLDDHRCLEEQYQILLEATRAGDLPTLNALWTEFERRLSTHMEGEERFVFTPLEPKHPETVKKLREDHQSIRELIATIGVSVDLHEARLRALEELGLVLRDHAAHENKTVYQLAAQEIDCGPMLRFLRLQLVLLKLGAPHFAS